MSLEPDRREQLIRDRSEWAMEWQSGFVLFSAAEVGHLLRVIDELRIGAVQPATIGEAARLILGKINDEARYLESTTRTRLEELAKLP